MSTSPSRRALLQTLGLALFVHMTGFTFHAQAADKWPSRLITLVVPYPAGGTSDAQARLVANELSKSLGQTVIVENKPGANGNIASGQVARAAADGYTIILSGVNSHAINAAIYDNMTFDVVKDFAHITMIASGPNAIAVHPDFPAKTLPDLVKEVKANPGKYNYASPGIGSSGHMSMELFKPRGDLKINHVPYKGGAPAITDVLGGQVPILVVNGDAVLPHVRSGKLRILAVTSPERSTLYPDTPTIAESGFPGLSVISWTGLSAPAGTPKDIVARLHDETVKAMQTAAIQERLQSSGLKVGANSPEEFSAFVIAEVAKWTEVAKAAGIKAE